MKDWQEIIKLYEKDNVYLGEAAQILIRYQTYEIPSLWKQMDKFEQQSDDALKKIKDLNKTETILKHDHITLCQQLGIKGDNLRNELIERLKELPKIYTDSINGIEELNDAIKLYTEFTNNSSLLPILKHLIKKSNTTVYEFIHKEAPIRIEENPIQLNLTEYDNNNGNNSNNNSDDDNGIDFGNSSDDNGNTTTTNSAEIIDFGDLNSNEDIQLDTTGDIDWGDTDTVATPAEEIDFDVPIEEYDIVIEGKFSHQFKIISI